MSDVPANPRSAAATPPDAPAPARPAPDPALKGKMLPGVAGIAMFMMFLTLVNVFGALTNRFGTGPGKYGVLVLCTMLIAGLFGLLRMRRWGWAIVLGGCFLLCAGYIYLFTISHAVPAAIQSAFMLVFFLYLVRSEVRDRTV